MPDTIARYQIIEPLGSGGMASVYRAYDPHFDREVAVKVIVAHFMHDDQLQERFRQEAKVIAGLEHPAIVPVYDFGKENGQPFLVMRLMSGGSLNDLRKKGNLSLQEVISLLERVAPALDMAHQRGIVHRDIKPDNILFDEMNYPYISDFGVAKLLEDTTLGLTQTGNPIGSPPYMSPEQARGLKQVDGRSDIYSLGVMLFELLAGQRPYKADSLAGYILQHLNEPIPNLGDINPTLPKACQSVILRALAKDPAQRYRTASEMVAELKHVAQTNHATRTNHATQTNYVTQTNHVTQTKNVTGQNIKSWWQQSAILMGGLIGLLILCAVIVMFSSNGVSGLLAVAATPTPTVTPTSIPTATLSPTSTSTAISEPTFTSTAISEPTFTSTAISEPTFTSTATSEPTSEPIPEPSSTIAPTEATPNAKAIAHLERGDALRKEGEHVQAIAEYTEAIRLDPNNTKAYFGRAFSHEDRGELDLAIANYTDAIRINPEFITAYYNRGVAYYGQDVLDLAISDYSEAIRLKPDYVLAYTARGRAYYKQNELDLAISDYDEAIRFDPDFAGGYYSRGLAYRRQDKPDLALADYNEAIRLDPDYIEVYFSRGVIYRSKGELELAIADYNEAIRLNPNYTDAYVGLGNAYYDKEELELALDSYNEAIRLDPNDALAYNNRGNAYRKQNQFDAAIQDYNESIRLNPNFANTYNNRGLTYEKKEQRELAIADYRKVLELGGRQSVTDYAKGRLEKLGATP